MGVRGLTTFLGSDSKTYFVPHELSDCYLIIDGSSAMFSLYERKKSVSAFGGDYDEFYKLVKDFFLLLKKCKVTPIVIIDGGHERKKLRTTIQRKVEVVPMLKNYFNGFSCINFYPLFLKHTFLDALEDFNVFFFQTYLEADCEIAAVARALNCPVLSRDSDYFIYDVLYIPIPYLQFEPIKRPDSNNYFLRCMLFDVNNFTNVSGLDKSLLPFLPVLLGNDYVDSSIFQKFFNHISVKKAKHKSFTQRKIAGVIRWLKNENVQSALKLILSHVGFKNKKEVMKAIETSIQNYTDNSISEPLIKKLKNFIDVTSLSVKNFELSLPPEIMHLFYQGKIDKCVVDIVNLGIYLTGLQVEVLNKSGHYLSQKLIFHLINILTPYLKNQKNTIKVYKVKFCSYRPVVYEIDQSSFTYSLSLQSVLKESREVRLGLLCKIVEIDENVLEIVSSNNSWSIFILCFIYWLKALGKELTQSHIHALILMAISNEVVQKSVGYFTTISKFNKSKINLMEKLKDTIIQAVDVNDFEEMLKNITLYEKLLMQTKIIPYRQVNAGVTDKKYSIFSIQAFSCFQSILLHIMIINALLDFPLPDLKISDFYSGTLLFNFFLNIKTKPKVTDFGCDLFKESPNLVKIYSYLCENLKEFFPK